MPDVQPGGYDERSPAERLLEQSWEARQRRASPRELVVESAAASLFVAVAAMLLISGPSASIRPGVFAVLVGVYAAVARIEFPVGAGSVVPTQLVLVPMIVLLPPASVPLAVALGLVISAAIDCALGRIRPRRMLGAIPDAWHAVGAAVVLCLAGSPASGFNDLPILAAALAACCVVDLVSSVARVRLAGVVRDLPALIRVMGLVWMVDACLAPVGLLAAVAARQSDAAILFVLPLVSLLWLLGRDRTRRIDQAQRRLRLVEHERGRLQSAVGHLGDAFAAKLNFERLLEILLHSSLEALDASAGRISLDSAPSARDLTAGAVALFDVLDRRRGAECTASDRPTQTCDQDIWTLNLGMRIGAAKSAVVQFVREGRAFEDDEIAMTAELIAKAELAAAEILAVHSIREQALNDALTGLGNRRKLNADLAAALKDRDASDPSVLLLFDLDGFKSYNDTFGHLSGDALLARLGARLEQAVAGHGHAYRLGGDEFCAHLCPADADTDNFIRRAAVALTESGSEFSIRASLGVVLLPDEADSPDHALQLADERMYADKRRQPDGARNQAREVLIRTMHAKQPELDKHSSNVARLAARVARQLGLRGEALDEIVRAAELHDVGKLGIPDAILNKPGELSAEEWTFMRQHTILGERILHGAAALRPIARLVRASHERWDGDGYPDRLHGEQIPLGARIVSVCDAYEDMTGSSPYRQAISHKAARQELQKAAGTQFDPDVVQAVLSVLRAGSGSQAQNPNARRPASCGVTADRQSVPRPDLLFE
ncbi:MAG: HD domain-containing phosphohydrolase [Solirubrobacteraceae bacterium]